MKTSARIGTALALACLVAAGASTVLAKEDRYWKGRPSFDVGETLGYFVWQDDQGWHVRWTTRGAKHKFSGTITCDGFFSKVDAVGANPRDFIRRTGDDRISFDTAVGGGRDGVDFTLSPSTKSLTFDLRMDGKPVAPAQVRIGAGKRRPASVPFTIDKR
jgi:hypothetical protein